VKSSSRVKRIARRRRKKIGWVRPCNLKRREKITKMLNRIP
jgi:hypothetical protein